MYTGSKSVEGWGSTTRIGSHDDDLGFSVQARDPPAAPSKDDSLKRIALENYDYLTRFRLLSLLADEVRAQSEPQTARRLPTFYALQVLDGKRQQRARLLFTLPVVEVA